jgi:VCBS repeat-containing protein
MGGILSGAPRTNRGSRRTAPRALSGGAALLLLCAARAGAQGTNLPPEILQGDTASLTVLRNTLCPNFSNRIRFDAEDADGDAAQLTWSVLTPPTTGTVSLLTSNPRSFAVYCYQPAAGQTTPDSFVVRVADPGGASDTVAVSVTVDNQPPAIAQGEVISLSVQKNSLCPNFSNRVRFDAADPDGDPALLFWSVQAPPASGTVTFLSTNPRSFVIACYQPNPDQIAADSFVIRVTDSGGATDSITVNVTVQNQAPAINEGNVLNLSVEEDSLCPSADNQVSLTATDADDAPAQLAWSILTAPATGTASLVGPATGSSATVCYQPAPDQETADAFVVQVADGVGAVDTIQISVSIQARADCPTLQQPGPLAITVQEDSTCAAPANRLVLTASDPDSAAGTLAWSTTPAARGTVSLPNGSSGSSVTVCYVPAPDANGSDSFTVSVEDGTCGGGSTVTVNVEIEPANDCPVIAQGATASLTVQEDSTCADAANLLSLTATDVDGNPAGLTWSAVAGGGGTISFPSGQQGAGVQVCYTPNANVNGPDAFLVSVTDGVCSATITVNVNILAVADCPVMGQAGPIDLLVEEDSACGSPANLLGLSASDLDTPPSQLSWSATAPALGAVSFPGGAVGSGVTICYTPNPDNTGNDSFVVSVSDGTCGTAASVTVNVFIAALPDCPLVQPAGPVTMSVAEDSGCATAANLVTLSATDADGPTELNWSATPAARGTVSFPQGTQGGEVQVCYTPAPDANGSDAFTVSVSDGTCGAAATVMIQVDIAGSPDCPVLQGPAPGPMIVAEDSACGGAGNVLTLSATDADGPGEVLTWSAAGAAHGTVTFPSGNTGAGVEACYVPAADYAGDDSFTVTVSDGTCPAGVSIAVTVIPVPDCPIITQGEVLAVTVEEDSTCLDAGNSFTLTAVDADVPADLLTWSASAAALGTVTFVNGNTGPSVQVCYAPNLNSMDPDSFTVSVGDGTCGGSDTIRVDVSVEGIPDCPFINEAGPVSLTVQFQSTCADPPNSFVLSASDPDSPPASLAWSATGAVQGTISFPQGNTGASVTLCYTPNAGAHGPETFEIMVHDGACSDSIFVNADIACGPPPTDCDGNGIPDGCETDSDGDGTIDACDGCPNDPLRTAPDDCGCDLPAQYDCQVLCTPEPLAGPSQLSFIRSASFPESNCNEGMPFRLFAGRADVAGTGKLWRVRQDCVQQPFGALLWRPLSVLVDINDYWRGGCASSNVVIVGGSDTAGNDYIYFLNLLNGAICETYIDNTLGQIGQMALSSSGRLFLGSIQGPSLFVLEKGVITPFCTVPGQSPRSVSIDALDNVYLTCSNDGVLRKIAPDGTMLDPSFAAGLEGAMSQSIASEGVFAGNLFVACNDRVMQVNLATRATTPLLTGLPAHGIALDPEGYLHVSLPTLNRIIKIGPQWGDMNYDGAIDLDDLPEFVEAMMRSPDAPSPLVRADADGDGCANSADIQAFVDRLLGG